MSENITLDGFSVCLHGKNDPRYFTTKADATHFSGCKGKIISINGLYEGMMDDAINVHGIYLKVQKRIDNNTLICEYAYPQTYGFDWGFPGDTIQFINTKTMETTGSLNQIIAIEAVNQSNVHGARKFKISFENPINQTINDTGIFGIENLTWAPEVYFASNIIRNNRARGSLFSTPRKAIIEKNTFDHYG